MIDASYKRSTYAKRIHASLTRARMQSLTVVKNLRDLKLVVFSDHHRGAFDGADQFKPCKAAYHAALGYYLEAGFELLLLGDVEDLWQVGPETATQRYQDTLRLEREFATRQRYTRIWGNHDNVWQDQNAVEKYLRPFLGNTRPVEALRLVITDNSARLGELFFAHGHQGTGFSDRYANVSKPLVRYAFNPLQRVLKYHLTTPATNYDLRYQHERAMFEWSKAQDVILVTGHTHRPVFTSETHGQYLREELAELKAALKDTSSVTAKAELQQRIYQKTAELHWVLAQTNGLDFEINNDATPCYFNTGCCSFSDGDITGLEIESGEIRLVRWPDKGHPWKRVLRRSGLRDIFEQVRSRDRVMKG